MAKSMIFLDYYNIMYEGHYENGRVWFLLKKKMNGWKKL
jgi:hypothetical protein